MIQLTVTTSSAFESLKKDEETLYFLEDTREIYKGNILYSNSIIFVTDLPKLALKNKIYINSITLECSFWDGMKWKKLFPKVSTVLQDGVKSDGLVTGNAVKNYITQRLQTFEKTLGSGHKEHLTTDDITLSKDIHVNVNSGSYKIGDIITGGTSLTEIVQKLFTIREPAVYIKPTLTIRPDSNIYEVGSIISNLITAEFEKNDAGELTKYSLDKILNDKITTLVTNSSISDYKEKPYIVTDTDNLRYIATVEYKNGAIKKDNYGEEYLKNRILAGKLTSELTIIGKRKAFFGSLNLDHDTEITSDIIRTLDSYLDPQQGTKFNINIKEGHNKVIFAYPSTLGDCTNVFSKVLNLKVKDAFKLQTLNVEGANKYKPILYNVYIYTADINYINNDVYTVTI